MKNSLFALLLLISLVACISPDNDDTGIDSNIYGQWTWIQTEGGIANMIQETSGSRENSVVLLLNRDGFYALTKNENKLSAGTFSISHQRSIYTDEMGDYLLLSPGCSLPDIVLKGIITVDEGGGLSITDNNYDGVSSFFRRLKSSD